MAAATQAAAQLSLQDQNAIARRLVIENSVEMRQPIYNATIVPATQNIVTVLGRPVGLVKGFYVQLTATIVNTAGAAINLTKFSVANLLRNVTLTDLYNQQRINTDGWHVYMVDVVKGRRVYGAAVTNDSPIGFGSNVSPISAPSTIAASGTATVRITYYVPCAYTHDDLRGAIYANTTTASIQLQLTINPNAIVSGGGDPTLAVYAGNPASVTSVTISVTQHYLDQIPQGPSGPVLPVMDLSTNYELKRTLVPAFTPTQEKAIEYANFRQFLSTFVVYRPGADPAISDIQYFALQSANFTKIWQVDPYLNALMSRQIMGTDFPLGLYYFSSREKPISSIQYGNMELVINPLTAGAGTYAIVGYENFSTTNTVSQAGSLVS